MSASVGLLLLEVQTGKRSSEAVTAGITRLLTLGGQQDAGLARVRAGLAAMATGLLAAPAVVHQVAQAVLSSPPLHHHSVALVPALLALPQNALALPTSLPLPPPDARLAIVSVLLAPAASRCSLEACRLLMLLLASDPHAPLRLAVVAALGAALAAADAPWALPDVAAALQRAMGLDPHRSVRLHALRALADADGLTVAMAVERARDRCAHVRTAALLVLEDAGPSAVVDATDVCVDDLAALFHATLPDTVRSVRAAAARLLVGLVEEEKERGLAPAAVLAMLGYIEHRACFDAVIDENLDVFWSADDDVIELAESEQGAVHKEMDEQADAIVVCTPEDKYGLDDEEFLNALADVVP